MQAIRPRRSTSVMLSLVFGFSHCSQSPDSTPAPDGAGGAGGSSAAGTAGASPWGGAGDSAAQGGAAGIAGSSGAGTASQGGGPAGAAGLGGSAGTAGTSAASGGAGAAGTGGSMDAAGSGGTAGAAGSGAAGASAAGGAAGAAGSNGAAGGGGGDCVSGGVLCDGFESYASGSPPRGGWTASARGNGAIAVDASRAFSGRQSLHVTGKLASDHANISTPLQTESAVLHVRFMMYTSSYPASSGVHTRLARLGIASAANGAPDSSYSLSTYNGTAIEKVNSIYLRDTGTKLNDPNLTGRWVCMEFGIDKTGGTGSVKVHLWVNGNELRLSPAGSSSHGMTSPSWDPIPFDLFMLGLDGFQNDALAANFWIDDLLIAPQRIGCPMGI